MVVISKDLLSMFLTKTSNLFKFSKLQYMFSQTNTVYPNFNVLESRLSC